MIQAFLGTYFKKRKEAIAESVRSLGEAELQKIEGEELSENMLLELLGSQSLFGSLSIVHIVNPAHSTDGWKILSKKFKEMSDSSTIFLLEEETLLQSRCKELSKYATMHVFDSKEVKKKTSPFAFKLTDAFLARDKKNMWIMYRAGLEKGEEPEALHGALMWQLKSLALAHDYATAGEAGLPPFVFSKSKNSLKNFSRSQTSNYIRDLTLLYHTSRESGENLSENLENWILEFK